VVGEILEGRMIEGAGGDDPPVVVFLAEQVLMNSLARSAFFENFQTPTLRIDRYVNPAVPAIFFPACGAARAPRSRQEGIVSPLI